MNRRFGFLDDDDAEAHHNDRLVNCPRCGKADLERVHVGPMGWQLYDGKKLHKCPAASPEEFPSE